MKILTIDELMALDIPEPSFVVEGMFAAGSATLFSARAKAGKGLFMLDCARCIAEGRPFLGRAVTQGPVIYFALEESPGIVRDRIKKMVHGSYDIPFRVALLDGSFEGQTFSLEDPLDIGAMRDKIAATRPVMVIIDVLREAHESDENDSGDMARVLKPVRQLAHEFNVCVVVTHHTNKDGRYRGSTAIPGAFDDQLEFRREDGDDEEGIRGLITGEGRNLPKLVQRVEFDQESHHWRAYAGAASSGRPAGVQQKIIDVLNSTDAWLTGGEIASRIEGVSRRSITNDLKAMRERAYPGMQVRGTGTKGDPFTYHGIQPKQDATHADGATPNGHASTFDITELWDEAIRPAGKVEPNDRSRWDDNTAILDLLTGMLRAGPAPTETIRAEAQRRGWPELPGFEEAFTRYRDALGIESRVIDGREHWAMPAGAAS